jgi:hypothetical protein
VVLSLVMGTPEYQFESTRTTLPHPAVLIHEPRTFWCRGEPDLIYRAIGIELVSESHWASAVSSSVCREHSASR